VNAKTAVLYGLAGAEPAAGRHYQKTRRPQSARHKT